MIDRQMLASSRHVELELISEEVIIRIKSPPLIPTD